MNKSAAQSLPILCLLYFIINASAQECCSLPTLPRDPSGQPDHPFSLGVSYGYTQTDGLQSGTRSVSQTEAGKRYPTTPTEMASYRVDARASYQFDPRYSMALTVPWVHHAMDLLTVGEASTMTADHSCCDFITYPQDTQANANKPNGKRHAMDPVEGFGDLRLEGTVRLLSEGVPESGMHQLYFSPGLKTPTGDYRVKSNGVYVDPSMQPGTGSWDPIAQLEYRYGLDKFGVGLIGGYQLATRNPQGYEFGDVASFGVFPSYQPFRMLRLTTGLAYRHIDRSVDHEGRYTDKRMLTKDPANTGGDLTDAVLSLDFLLTSRLTLNAGVSVPVWSDLNGIQMEPGTLYTVGASVRF